MHTQKIGLLTGAILLLLVSLSAQPAMADTSGSQLEKSTNQRNTNLGQASTGTQRNVTGIVNSFQGSTLDLRLADGTCKTFSVEPSTVGSQRLRKGTLVTFDADANRRVTRIQQPEVAETINGIVTKIANDQVTLRLPNGQTRTTVVAPATAQQLKLVPGVPIATTLYRGTSLTKICVRALDIPPVAAAPVPVVQPPIPPAFKAPQPVKALW